MRDSSFYNMLWKKCMFYSAFSVKQLIHTIEEQVKNPTLSPTATTCTSPLSPTIPIIENTTPRRNSTDGVNGVMKRDLEKSDVITGENRRQSEGGGGQMKSLLRKKEGKQESRQSMGHRYVWYPRK